MVPPNARRNEAPARRRAAEARVQRSGGTEVAQQTVLATGIARNDTEVMIMARMVLACVVMRELGDAI